jgi:hypothetical protein
LGDINGVTEGLFEKEDFDIDDDCRVVDIIQAMSPLFTLSRQGQEFGPYTREQLQAMSNSGDLLPEDLIWCEGMPQWEYASTIFKAARASGMSAKSQAKSVAPSSPNKLQKLISSATTLPLTVKIGVGAAVLVLVAVGLVAAAGGFASPQDKFFSTVRTFPGRTIGTSKMVFDKDLKYDVKKSDSVVSPYQASLSGTIQEVTESNPEKPDVYAFTATFGYQDGIWVVNDDLEMTLTSSLGTRAVDEFNSFASMARNAVDNGTSDQYELAALAQLAKEKRREAETSQNIDALAIIVSKQVLLKFLHEQFQK